MLNRLLINETIKASRLKFTYLGIFFAILPVLLWIKVVQAFGEEHNLNTFLFIATAVQASLTGVVPIFIVIFSALLVASEATGGTLRLILTRPVTRLQFLSSKLIIALGYTLLLLILNFLTAILIAGVKYGFSNLISTPATGGESSGSLHLWRYMFASIFLSFFPLVGFATFGYCMSVLVRNVGHAVGFAVGIILGVQSIKHLISFGSFSFPDYWFATYVDVPLAQMIDIIGGYSVAFFSPRLGKALLISMIYNVVLVLIAFIVFHRRDLN